MAKNDILMYGGLTILGLYAVYVVSKNLNKAAGGAANVPVAIGDLAKTTGSAAGQAITTTGTQASNILEGAGKTVTNVLELTQATTAAPLNFLQRLNKAYQDIAPIDYLKDKYLMPLMR